MRKILIGSAVAAIATSKSFSDAPYQAQTAEQKMGQLWKEIVADQTPYGWYSAFSLGGIFFESMKPTFDYYSDEIPNGRKKYIHSVGAVAQAELIPEAGSPYTGMFQGVKNVLVRVSAAKQYNKNKPAMDNFAPGMGIKLLRDGVPSANLVAMKGVNGQDSWNTFKYDWTNHIPTPEGFALKLLGKKFSEATPYIARVGTKTWAHYDEKGVKVEESKMKFPFHLIFRPHAEVNTKFPDTFELEMNDQLKTIKTGTALFDVLATENPDSEPVKIATIRTKSEFVTSKWGDKNLFFQHNYSEDDISLHPNWKEACAKEPRVYKAIMEKFHQ